MLVDADFFLECENLAGLCLQLGKLEEGRKLINDGFRIKTKSLPADHPDIICGKF